MVTSTRRSISAISSITGAMIRSLSVTAIGVDMALGGVGHAFVNIL